ncbi:MAG: SH3 domain-containing protein [Anaerolineales bacterium]|nr:SH3 domain-containing protein [Anaerolineales bacterium]
MKTIKDIYKTPIVLMGTVVVALVIILVVLSLLIFLPGRSLSSASSTPLMTIIPGSTNTLAIPTSTVTPALTATSGIPPSPLPGMMGIGAVVQIYGTEGEGLNIRSEPGLDGKVNFLGYDSEVFEVVDGPEEVDGFSWWQLRSPADETRAGWAAANYLSVMTNASE